MDNCIKIIILVTICMKMVYSFPVDEAVEKNLNAAVKKSEQKQRLNNKLIMVDSIISKIILPSDTESQKDAKKLIAKYLIQLASQANSSVHQKSSKSSSGKNVESSYEDDKMKETIIAALIEAEKLSQSQNYDSRVSRQLNLTTTTEASTTTVNVTSAANVTTASTVPPSKLNAVEKHQTEVMNHVKDLVQNVQNGNLTAVLNTGLRVASVETIGVVVNGLLNIVLCNPFDRWNGNCNLNIMKMK